MYCEILTINQQNISWKFQYLTRIFFFLKLALANIKVGNSNIKFKETPRWNTRIIVGNLTAWFFKIRISKSNFKVRKSKIKFWILRIRLKILNLKDLNLKSQPKSWQFKD